MYASAIEDGVANYYLNHPEKTNVTIEELEKEGLINYKGEKVKCETVQIWKGKIYLSDCSVGNNKIDYDYGKVQVETPELNNGLIPVIYKNNKWIVVDKSDPEWYDYGKQKWANAVTLLPDVTKEVGDEVKVDGTEASMMLVWIPRFEYKYTNLGDQYAGGTAEQPGEISINFISKETTTPSSDEYKIHPAFTFGNKELSGIWVGKFELSHTTKSQGTGNDGSDYTAANLNCTTDTCSEAQYLRTLPNKPSLRYNNVSNFWYGIKSIENTSSFRLSNIDIHMMKNSEWGAVAYLSQSKYGKYGNNDYKDSQKEVYVNNSNRYTGRSAANSWLSAIENGITYEYNDYGYYTYDGYLIKSDSGVETSTRDINKGTGASTTGNIYGVYDMNGGSIEYVMGVYGDSNGIYSGKASTGEYKFYNSGFNGRTSEDNQEITNGAAVPDSKYYDKYVTFIEETACNGVCFGHAISETEDWYKNGSSMVKIGSPWLVRGGAYIDNSLFGIFFFSYNTGAKHSVTSTRVIGIQQN